MKLIVTTFDVRTDKQIAERVLNYAQLDARVWLQKHIAWAANNGHAIEICNEADEKLAA